jgi:Tfp pilus assembly protein PilN
MRAVNLLPERHRPRGPSGGRKGSSYLVLGVLGAVLVGVVLYVLMLNSINSSRAEIAKARAETARLQAESQQLGPYGDFAKVKEQRVNSVRQLASQRFDWERMVRELAHVLPSGVWLTQASAADNAADAGSTGASTGAPPTGGPTSPVLTLQGCAANQSDVAVTLVRMRELQGATDVTLDHSTGGGSGSSSGSGSSAPGSCGSTHGQPNYSFQIGVTFAPLAAIKDTPGSVPASLGGGE